MKASIDPLSSAHGLYRSESSSPNEAKLTALQMCMSGSQDAGIAVTFTCT